MWNGFPAQFPPRRGAGAIEVVALVALTAGSLVLWVLGPILGIVLVWVSDRWTRNEKIVATAIVFGALVLQFLMVVGVLLLSMQRPA